MPGRYKELEGISVRVDSRFNDYLTNVYAEIASFCICLSVYLFLCVREVCVCVKVCGKSDTDWKRSGARGAAAHRSPRLASRAAARSSAP